MSRLFAQLRPVRATRDRFEVKESGQGLFYASYNDATIGKTGATAYQLIRSTWMQWQLIENVCVCQKNSGERLSEWHTQTQHLPLEENMGESSLMG
jgi:hypothetical protein